MKDNPVPEERLLKLIRQEKKSKGNSTAQKAPDVKTAPHPPKTEIKNGAYLWVSRFLTMRQLQRVMVVAAAASFIYLIASFVYPWVGLREIRLPVIPQEEGQDSAAQIISEPKPYEFYQKELSQKQIFKTQYTQEEKTAAIPTDIELTKEINLVGIISGDNPQAIIEDRRTQKTFYVTKGQFIGDYKVEDIQEGRIILEFQGKRYELNM
jgi:hypothetical protein